MEQHQNPYLNARREWTERYGDYIIQAKNWRLAAIGSMVIAAVISLSLIISITQHKVVPYIIEVDKLGKVTSVTQAELSSNTIPDIKIIKHTLSRFIEDTRSITTDKIVQKRGLEKIYAYLPKGSSASHYIQEYINANNPFKLAETRTISIEITSVLPISDKSYEIEWNETARDLHGAIISTNKWKSAIIIDFNPPTSEEAIIANPLGLFVTQISWTREL